MNILFDIGMATGPVIGYVHQYRMISIQKQVGSFSIDICGILLFANILRLNFYIFNKYQLALFFQSVVMITAQVFLVHICTKYANKQGENSRSEERSQSDEKIDRNQFLEDFWRWKQFSTYFIFIAAFSFITFSVSIIFYQLEFYGYGIFLGLVALLSQSVLILPQILKNYYSKSTKGLSHILVILNLSGDIFKLIYFIIKHQPFQFILCGVIQVCLDSFVIIQIFYYKKLQDENFSKQHKSLVTEKNNGSIDVKIETEENFNHIQMKNIPTALCSPDVDDQINNNRFQEDVETSCQEEYENQKSQNKQQTSQESLKKQNASLQNQRNFGQEKNSQLKKSVSQKIGASERDLFQDEIQLPSKSAQAVTVQSS